MEKLLSRLTSATNLDSDAQESFYYQSNHPSKKFNNNKYQIQIQNDYLDKLKEQREKIQKLSKQYKKISEELECKNQIILGYEIKFKSKEQNYIYKKKYDQSYKQIKVLNHENKKLKEENQSLKQQILHLNNVNTQSLKEIKSFLTSNQYKYKEQVLRLREIIQQKCKQFEILQSKHDQSISQLKKELNNSKLKNQDCLSQNQTLKNEYEYKLTHINQLLMKKDLQIKKLQQESEKNKEYIKNLHIQMQQKEQNAFMMQQDFANLLLKIKTQIKNLKSQIHDKKQLITQYKQKNSKLTETIKNYQKQIEEFKETLKQGKIQFQQQIDKYKFQVELQKKQLIETNKDLKNKLDEVASRKIQIQAQNKRLFGVLKKKQNHESNIKKAILIEHNQIDRLERLFDTL